MLEALTVAGDNWHCKYDSSTAYRDSGLFSLVTEHASMGRSFVCCYIFLIGSHWEFHDRFAG
jgi:hypothetical protein